MAAKPAGPTLPRLLFRRASLWKTRGGPGAGVLVDVLCEDGRVSAVSQTPLPQLPGDWEVAARGRLLVPGFVDGHTHLERRLARGLTAGATYPRSHPHLEEPLRSRFERALELPDLQVAARLALAEAALSGTTAVFALCRAPGCAEGSLDGLAEAAARIGLRAVLAYGASQHNGALSVGLDENARFCKERSNDPMVRGMVGMAHPDEVSDAVFDQVGDLARRHGLHLHVSETEHELAVGFHTYGRRTIERLAHVGLLGPRTLAAHANHLNRTETLALGDGSCTCAFTPRPSLFSEEPPPRPEAALNNEVHGVLGTDGGSSAVSAELAHALILWRRSARSQSQQGFYALDRLAVGGARLVHRVFDGPREDAPADATLYEPGRIRIGDLADLVLLEDHGALPAADVSAPMGSIVQYAQAAAEARVAWTVVGGRVLVREGELLTADLADLSAQARERAEVIWKRL